VVSGVQAAWRVQLRAKHPVGESPTETKDSSFVAWEASWRESKATEPSDIWLEGAMQNTRSQHNVNVHVASLLIKVRWLRWSCHSESNKSRIETSPKRRLSPAGYQRRHGVKDGVSTGEALDVRQGKLAEEMTAITVSGKCRRRHQGVGSGHNVRQEKLMETSGCESRPAKVVADRLVSSLAGGAVTYGLKRRQRSCEDWD